MIDLWWVFNPIEESTIVFHLENDDPVAPSEKFKT